MLADTEVKSGGFPVDPSSETADSVGLNQRHYSIIMLISDMLAQVWIIVQAEFTAKLARRGG